MKNTINHPDEINKRGGRLPKKQSAQWMKKGLTFPNIIIFLGLLSALIYIFSYLFPFTDNAFVVSDLRPVAAQVRGYVTHMYVENGMYVKRGQKLFSVFNKPYLYAVEQLTADYESAEATLNALELIYDRDQKTSDNRKNIYLKLQHDLEKYRKGYQMKSISRITMDNAANDTYAAKDAWQAQLKQQMVDNHRIRAQLKQIESIAARLKNAKVQLRQTEVYAQANGVIQNLFLTKGSPININSPLFTLVYTDQTYIQANFNETDLRNVHKGSKVFIYPRMYLSRKVFHGEVVSDYWSANRQNVDIRTQLQSVTNENQWILLPQRLPVIIRVTDPDIHFPLRVGSSAYVYIKGD